MTDLPPAAYALGLSLLPGSGPASLGVLMAAGDPERAWADVRDGRAVRPLPRSAGAAHRPVVAWADAATHMDLVAEWHRARRAGVEVTWAGRDDYPSRLVGDPAPPPILFWVGSLSALDAPCVALVGTRQATFDGRTLAFQMGRDLAAAGVCVVSGLALGIDGAAHRGALASGAPAATVGVAASGCDRVYPARHAGLWAEVAARGAIVSETPPGRPAQTWRFPARNRIIAGLVSMVVVVESHATGGSLITADAAIERGIEVRAVPGSVHSPASNGTNQLLYDGPGPVRNAGDVLLALGLNPPTRRQAEPRPAGEAVPSARTAPGARAAPSGSTGPVGVRRPLRVAGRAGSPPEPAVGTVEAAVLEAIGGRPRTLNWLAARCGLPVGVLARALDDLAGAGRVAEERGWWQRVR